MKIGLEGLKDGFALFYVSKFNKRKGRYSFLYKALTMD